jgi:HSP20 family protein
MPGVPWLQMTRKRDIDQLQREIQELFADLWQVPRFSMGRAGFRPHADCYRTSDPAELTVLVELPGVAAQDVDLVVADGTLTVSGKRVRPRCAGQVYQQLELDYGPFRRQIALGEDADVSRARATLEDGVLKVVLPLAQRRVGGERVSIVVTRS